MPHTPARLAREAHTLDCMLRLFCRSRHGSRELCPDCGALLDYARGRLDKCPFGEGKPACSTCRIHCYRPERRERIRRVMRFAGPRMLWRHPVLAVLHWADKWRKGTVPHIP